MPGAQYVAANGKRYPARYFEGLTRPQQLLREKELASRAESKAKTLPKLGQSDKQFLDAGKQKHSKYTTLFHKHYPDQPFNKTALAKRFALPYRKLDAVYKRGERAWQTSGSRPGANAYQWGAARLMKFLLIEDGKISIKAGDPDTDLHTAKVKG